MVSTSRTVSFKGVEAIPVEVQVSIQKGLPAFNIVGLPDKTVTESRERIRSAFSFLGMSLPPARITVNLSPSSVVKEGSHYDLPIAIALLSAMNLIPKDVLSNYIAWGELSLSGKVKPSRGLISAGIFALSSSLSIIVPDEQLNELFLLKDKINIVSCETLQEVIHFFSKEIVRELHFNSKDEEISNKIDMSYIKGQYSAKKALEVAAAGGHSLLMVGPPGSGKTTLASAITSIMSPLSYKEQLETTMIYSLANELNDNSYIRNRPYRAPHHSASTPALIGGGSKSLPGEVSLSHNGILFLDELAEFSKHALDALRQPLESYEVNISRVSGKYTYPAKFQLIAAMNPCRCGYFGIKDKECNKAPKCFEDYKNKISAPVLDRIDLTIEVPHMDFTVMSSNIKLGETSHIIKQRVVAAQEIQKSRYKGQSFSLNAYAPGNIIDEVAAMPAKTKDFFVEAVNRLQVSNRAYYRIIKTAMTIADLENSTDIKERHISSALTYRSISYT